MSDRLCNPGNMTTLKPDDSSDIDFVNVPSIYSIYSMKIWLAVKRDKPKESESLSHCPVQYVQRKQKPQSYVISHQPMSVRISQWARLLSLLLEQLCPLSLRFSGLAFLGRHDFGFNGFNRFNGLYVYIWIICLYVIFQVSSSYPPYNIYIYMYTYVYIYIYICVYIYISVHITSNRSKTNPIDSFHHSCSVCNIGHIQYHQ